MPGATITNHLGGGLGPAEACPPAPGLQGTPPAPLGPGRPLARGCVAVVPVSGPMAILLSVSVSRRGHRPPGLRPPLDLMTLQRPVGNEVTFTGSGG